MAASFDLLKSYYSNNPRPGEKTYVRNHDISVLEDLKQTLNHGHRDFQFTEIKEFIFTMKNVMGKELKFYIKPCGLECLGISRTKDTKEAYFFGWAHEGFMEASTWHHICNDICLYYGRI